MANPVRAQGYRTQRKVTCTNCRLEWLVEPKQTGKMRCPSCKEVCRIRSVSV